MRALYYFSILNSSLTDLILQPAVTSRSQSHCAELEASMQRSTALRPGSSSSHLGISFLFIEMHRRPFAQPARQGAGRFEAGEAEGVQMQMQEEGSVVDQLRDRQVDD